MEDKIEMKIRFGKISAFVLIGMFIAMMFGPLALAADVDDTNDYIIDIDYDGGDTSIFAVSHEGGSELLRLEETGRLGVGDTSPDFKLEVTGSSGSGYFGVTSSSSQDFILSCILDLFF